MRDEEGRPRVLVVDDTDQVRLIALRTLQDGGFNAVAAVDGQTALLLIYSLPPGWFDLIITNSLMPRMRGEELARRVRERDPDQRLLHMTGHPDVRFDVDDGVADAIPAIRKPFTPDELIRVACELVGAR